MDKKTPVDEHTPIAPPQYQGSSSQQHYQSLPFQQQQPTTYVIHGSMLPGPGGDPYAAAVEAADRRSRKRFCAALLYATAIWVLFVLITGGITMDEMGYKRRGHRHGYMNIPHDLPVDVRDCKGFKISNASPPVQVDDRLLESTTHLRMEVSEADLIYFHSHGGWSHGQLDFALDRSDKNEKMVVEIVARYDDEDLLDEARICRVDSDRGKGIELWTPERESHGRYDHSRLTFHVTYHLPLDTFKSLEVSSSIFTINGNDALTFADSAKVSTSNAHVRFVGLETANVDIQSSNAPIDVEHLVSTSGSLTTSNGRINVDRAAIDDLAVHTTNAAIRGIFSTKRHLDLHNSNGLIDVDIDLVESDSDSLTKPAQFDIVAVTSNSGSEVRYKSQPRGSSLLSTVKTSNGHAKVTHASEFTGTYKVSTSNGRTTVQRLHDEHDKEGKRTRFHEAHSGGRAIVSGIIGWRNDKDGSKEVAKDASSEVTSSNAPVELYY